MGQRFSANFDLKFALQRGEKGGNANFKIKHTEPLNQEITPPLYSTETGILMSNSNLYKPRVLHVKRDIEDRIWTPDTFFRNSVDVKLHDLPNPNRYARIAPDGGVTLSER